MEKSKNKLTSNAQDLRKNMTKEERHLWYDFLKALPINVNRQKVIGDFIVDFYIPSKNIVIEIDGTQHFEEKGLQKDHLRDAFLVKKGLIVLRYSNRDINTQFERVCEDILNHF